MQNAISLNQEGFINLYDNDMTGLRKTLSVKNYSSSVTFKNKSIFNEKIGTFSYEWSEYFDYFKASYYLHISYYT